MPQCIPKIGKVCFSIEKLIAYLHFSAAGIPRLRRRVSLNFWINKTNKFGDHNQQISSTCKLISK